MKNDSFSALGSGGSCSNIWLQSGICLSILRGVIGTRCDCCYRSLRFSLESISMRSKSKTYLPLLCAFSSRMLRKSEDAASSRATSGSRPYTPSHASSGAQSRALALVRRNQGRSVQTRRQEPSDVSRKTGDGRPARGTGPMHQPGAAGSCAPSVSLQLGRTR